MNLKTVWLFPALFFIITCHNTEHGTMQDISYPKTKKVDTVDQYFGTEVPDPYRWLENDLSDETAEWVKEQNALTFSYLDKIPYRNTIKEKLSELWNYEKQGTPFIRGDYEYFYKNDGLQNHSVLYRKKTGKESEAKVFLDPNKFSDDGTTSLAGLSFSEDGSLAAYAISEGGSDWRKVLIINTESMEMLDDTLQNIKFSGLSWRGNEGIYYSSYEMPDGSILSARTDKHILYFHTLGTSQADDQIIYGSSPDEKSRYISGNCTEDGKFLFISRKTTTSGNELYVKDLNTENSPLKLIIKGFDYETGYIDNEDDTLFFLSNYRAPNRRLVSVDASDPSPENWVDVIPETEHTLTVRSGKGMFFAIYMQDAVNRVKQFDYSGKLIREVELPGIGTVGGFGAKKNDSTIYYSFRNYYTPSSIYKYDEQTGKSSLYWNPDIAYNSEDYISEQVFYRSKDGTKIPMIISYKKGLQKDGKNPTILYGYGGFNISLTPSFSLFNAIWMNMGGIYAVPNIRGGGEYGREWHDAGIKMKKQNVFDDFIAAGEYLIENKYTSTEKLCLRGGSNGGLLLGATVNQRPDLMAVAIPAVGVMDMLRYHKFTSGEGWAYDYGTSEDSEEMFGYLYNYSPLHNIGDSLDYPAILVTTGDHDDRVVPAHSFKYIAELQASETGPAPTLIRIETKAGHGAGKSVSKVIDEYSDIFGFIFYNMGYAEKLPE